MTPRRLLLPLEPLYAASVALRNVLYDLGLLPSRRLAWPVLSVGNLSTGGAGKTPFVLALRPLLASLGWQSDVLSRGYGRLHSATAHVDPAGSAAQFGDEPLLLARAGADVYVAADRYRAGLLAELSSPGQSRLHILDDGLQHRRLARDIEIVLVLRSDLADRLLPAGNLREPLTALRRAHIVVLREEDADLAPRIRALNPGAPLWLTRRSLRFTTLDAQPAALPRQPLAFCALARPDGFFASLRQAGCATAATVAFRDHHPYTLRDAQSLAARARALHADSFVLTAKDACKLTPPLAAALAAAAPVTVAELTVTLLDPVQAAARLSSLLDSIVRG